MQEYFDLYDYRQRVIALYKARNESLQKDTEPSVVLDFFRKERDRLFHYHAQSALDTEQKATFQGIPYFPYNPAMTVMAELTNIEQPQTITVPKNSSESMTIKSVAHANFTINNQVAKLTIYWIDVYGGGLFLPFRDGTSPEQSYGAGRYLFDTVKGSNFLETGTNEKRSILLDFNYAYNPSCAYNAQWVCPLAPEENRLQVSIAAGEKKYHD